MIAKMTARKSIMATKMGNFMGSLRIGLNIRVNLIHESDVPWSLAGGKRMPTGATCRSELEVPAPWLGQHWRAQCCLYEFNN